MAKSEPLDTLLERARNQSTSGRDYVSEAIDAMPEATALKVGTAVMAKTGRQWDYVDDRLVEVFHSLGFTTVTASAIQRWRKRHG